MASVEECAKRIVELVGDEELRSRIGGAARARVRERFLTLRELTDYLELMRSLS